MTSFLTPRQYFKLRGGRPRKRFGQNFLEQPATAERIVASAHLEPSQVAVEIGPGLGALTRHIFPRVNRLHLIELDRDLAAYLEQTLSEMLHSGEAGHAFRDAHPSVSIHVQDVMTFDFSALSHAEGAPLVVLGNLPYQISSPLMFHLLESRAAISHAVFMVQKEVGERFTARPSTREYGVLSVLLAIYAKATPLFLVGPGQFFPPPQVDSMVLRVDYLPPSPEADELFPFVRRLVSLAFQKRRKTLLNALKDLGHGDRDLLMRALSSLSIDPQRRPETLTPREFLDLAQALEGLLP